MTTADLHACGHDKHAISRWVRGGRLHRVFRGVYSLGPVLAPLARELAAVMACGEGAAISHRSAAALWGIRPPWQGRVDVSVATANGRAIAGIEIHRPKHIDKVIRNGIPLTPPARTILDLADLEPPDSAINEGLAKRLTSRKELLALSESSEGRRGATQIRAALHDHTGYTRSKAERVLKDLVGSAGLPKPEFNRMVGDYECDAVWRSQKVVVEVDGFATHQRRATFERDRRKDQALMENGWRVVRITWRQLTTEPLKTAATITRALYASP